MSFLFFLFNQYMPKNTNKKTLKKKEFNNSELKPTNKQAYLNCFFLILK